MLINEVSFIVVSGCDSKVLFCFAIGNKFNSIGSLTSFLQEINSKKHNMNTVFLKLIIIFDFVISFHEI